MNGFIRSGFIGSGSIASGSIGHKLARMLLFLCSACLLQACDSPKLATLGSADVVVAFGDSLTAGVGASRGNSYPSVLARLSGLTVVNAGVSGETTHEGLLRLPKVIEEHNPRLLILLEGGNDILRNKSFAQVEKNLDRMIQLALDRGIQVVLIGVPEKNLFSSSAPFYRALAEKHDLVFDANLIAGLMRSPSKKSDAIHFNDEGYALMAEGIYELLSDHGAIN